MSHVSIPADAPAGGIFWKEPATTTVSYYKLAPSYTVSLQWNLTSLYITPTSLTFSAYCSSNKNTYPIGPTVIPGTQTELLWVPWDYQTGQGVQTPLVQGTYTLEVQDERGTTALGTAGMYQFNNAITFAVYTPQPYTPLAREFRFLRRFLQPSLTYTTLTLIGLVIPQNGRVRPVNQVR